MTDSENTESPAAAEQGAGTVPAGTASASANVLADWEIAVCEVFCRAAAMLGLRKSVGFVYGALYCAGTPLSVEELRERLQISRGSAVEALQLLRRFGAVRTVFKVGERRDFFEAETNLRKFALGALREIFIPGLEKTEQRLEHAGTLAGGNAVASAKIAELRRRAAAFSALLPQLDALFASDDTAPAADAEKAN